MKKMTGMEYKAMMGDDWNLILGTAESYIDGQEVTVNGSSEPEDWTEIDDSAKVVINDGVVFCEETGIEIPFEKFITQWRKLQTHTTITVQVPNGKVDALKAFIKALK